MTSRVHDRRPRLGRALVGATTAALLLALSACGGGSDSDTSSDATSDSTAAADLGEVRLQLSWIKNEEFAGEFFADSQGYYTDEGISKVVMTPGPSTGAAELLSDKTDVALSDAVSIGSVVANEEAPLKIIGATYQKNPFTILSLKDGGDIATPEDMIGKKIGVQDSNTSLFKALLAANGISEDDVTVVPVQYDPSVLVNGDVDGFVAYLTNEAITVAAEGNEVTNLPFADNGLPFVAETFTVTDQTLAEKRDLLKAFMIAEIKGWTDNIADPEEGSRLAVEEYGKDLKLNMENSVAGNQEQVSSLVVSDETAENGLFTISDDLQAETVESLAAAGIEVEASDLFDTSLIDEIYEENPDLKAYAK